MASFYGWGSTTSRLELLWRGSLLFTTKFPEIPGTHFIDLRMMKDWVDPGATQWFWVPYPWIGKIMTQNAEKYLTQEFCWFWPNITHDLSDLVGIACFNFSRNLLLSFLARMIWNSNHFKGRWYIFKFSFSLLVIIKQAYLFFWNLNVQSFTLFI